MSKRVVFMGTPDFGVPSLRALANRISPGELRVVTQPDRPAGRGRRLQPPPVKQHADELELQVTQVDTLRDPAIRDELTTFSPDLIVVAAFGLLLPRWVLELPTHGCINLHASLLPRFRGASPIPAAIACGDTISGVSLMRMERGLDTGDVFACQEEEIRQNDTSGSLTERLAEAAAGLLQRHQSELLRGTMTASPQQGDIVETRKILKEHGAVDWDQDAVVIERHVRAMWPWPRAWTVAQDGTRVQIHETSLTGKPTSERPGTVAHEGGRIVVATRDEWLQLDTIQLPGKNAQPSGNQLRNPVLANGAQLDAGAGFDAPEPWIVSVGEAGPNLDS